MTDLCSKGKNEYVKSNIYANSNNQVKFWKNLNNLWGSTKSKTCDDILLNTGDSDILSPANTTSHAFNMFFSNVAKKIQNDIRPLNDTEGGQLYN